MKGCKLDVVFWGGGCFILCMAIDEKNNLKNVQGWKDTKIDHLPHRK